MQDNFSLDCKGITGTTQDTVTDLSEGHLNPVTINVFNMLFISLCKIARAQMESHTRIVEKLHCPRTLHSVPELGKASLPQSIASSRRFLI